PAQPEQWGAPTRPADFYDLKGDLEALFAPRGLRFDRMTHPALHPGQTAEIRLRGQRLGFLGLLHPKLEKELGLETRVFVFELDQDLLLNRAIPSFKPLSKFPQVRRDIAVLVDAGVTASGLLNRVRQQSPLIRQALVFDVYQGAGIEAGQKSVALGLVLQDDAETLTDAKVDAVIADVLARLAEDFNAKLRD
ncbi:MAG: phenylalanine--tRNA ligase subunit beta, partial [Candidatus Methylumidiphilus sp.]